MGRRLASATRPGSTKVNYTYNADGLLTSKKKGSIEYYYYWNGDKLTAQTDNGNTWYFRYDGDTPIGFEYNGTEYYYVTNLQGDIIAILDSNGTCVVEYEYDAWGNCTVTKDTNTIAHINPIRYRGYYYDSDTDLYYLQSRYYDANTGRFINADEPTLIGANGGVVSNNLFAYCDNNPVMKSDPDGNIAASIIGAVIGGIVGALGGYFLTNWLADKIGLKGWKRKFFVWGLSGIITAAAATIGYFIGPYVAKIAVKLGKYIAKLIRKGKIAFKKLSGKAKSAVKTLLKESCCFVAGTMINTSDGEVPIEEIKVGDKVYSQNTDTGEVSTKTVKNVFVKETQTIYHIKTDYDEILVTGEHPFWVDNKGWVVASELVNGDQLCMKDGDKVSVLNNEVEYLNSPIKVYNFEVEDWHTYYVSSSNILVHNAKCSLTKISDSYLKKKGFNAHEIKYDVLGSKAKISQYNLFYDKSSGAIFILKNGAKESAKIATGYFIK